MGKPTKPKGSLKVEPPRPRKTGKGASPFVVVSLGVFPAVAWVANGNANEFKICIVAGVAIVIVVLGWMWTTRNH